MKFRIIYPRWAKLHQQTEFHLPPHGPVVFAASLPEDIAVDFIDENLQAIDFDDPVDMVGISMMLTIQIKRGWEIADAFRARGVKVIFGGIATMLHAEETQAHADSVFLGEAEGRMEGVIDDFRHDRLKPVYDYLDDRPPIEWVGTARRDILDRGPLQLQGHPDGGPGACLPGLPLQLLSLLRGLPGGAAFPPPAHREDHCRDGRPSTTTGFLSWTIPWPRTPSGKGTSSGK